MKTRLITTALVAAAFFAVGSGVDFQPSSAALPIQAGTAPQRAQNSAVASTARHAPERLRTMVVLPEVTVRPSREEIRAAFADPSTPVADQRTADADFEVATVSGASPDPRRNLPRLSFDMPYYSFGKVLPSVSRD